MVLSNAERQARHRARLKALAEGLIEVIIVVRERQRAKPEHSINFALPALPRPGDYISVFRPDSPTHSEDLVVRKVWWNLRYDDSSGYGDSDNPMVGRLRDIMVECDQAIGPYARDHWRDGLVGYEERGNVVERFDVERLSIREDELKAMAGGKDD